MEALSPQLRSKPARWQIEWEVCEIAAMVSGVARDRVLPNSRMIEELGLDSLALIEFMYEIEDRYGIHLFNSAGQDESCKQVFTRRPLLLWDIAEAIEMLWDTRGTNNSKRWRHRVELGKACASEFATPAPFLQLGGWLSQSEWMRGALYEPLGPTGGGQMQFRRRTDGLRCVVLPSANVRLGSGDQPPRLAHVSRQF